MSFQKNVDTFLHYANSHSLSKISKQNEVMLKQAAIQNAQMSVLNEQISQANAVNMEILKNQLQQLEREQEQSFYKDMTFLISQVVDEIESVDDPMIKLFFYDAILDYLKNNSELAMNSFVEISDKNTAKTIIGRLKDIQKSFTDEIKNKFNNSIFLELLTVNARIEKIDNENQIIEPVKPTEIDTKEDPDFLKALVVCPISGILGYLILFVAPHPTFFSIIFGIICIIAFLGTLIFILLKISEKKETKQKYKQYLIDLEKYDQAKKEYDKKIEPIKHEIEIANKDLTSLQNKISEKYPQFSEIKSNLDSLFANFNMKWSRE